MIEKDISLSVAVPEDHETIRKICHALSSAERIKIMQLLQRQNKTLSEISKEIDTPFSSVLRHIEVLLDAGLISSYYKPGLKGTARYCSPELLHFDVFLEGDPAAEKAESEESTEMPIGMFAHCHVSQPCGMLGKEGPIGEFDDPRVLFSPERVHAECLWFTTGYVSYNFPTVSLLKTKRSEISFSFECCSEAPYYNSDWPSDITLSINGNEITTFTCPSDFGGRRGKFTPQFWPITSTQFGLLKKLTVNEKGAFLDNVLVNPDITFSGLDLCAGNAIQFTLAVKEDAVHKGGINIFGANFGNYPQHIIMSVR